MCLVCVSVCVGLLCYSCFVMSPLHDMLRDVSDMLRYAGQITLRYVILRLFRTTTPACCQTGP